MKFLVPPVKRFAAARSGGTVRIGRRICVRVECRHGTPRLAGYVEYLCADAGLSRCDSGVRALTVVICIGSRLLRGTGDMPADRAIRNQAYRLKCAPGKVSIEAESETGGLYGLVTLRQIILSALNGEKIPAGTITDWPSFQWRGLQDDLARSRAFDMGHAKNQIRHLADLKGNLYQVYLESRFRFPSRPDAGMPGSMTPADARELDRYARSLGVTVAPAVNVFGHMELLLSKKAYRHLREDPANPFAICPLHPETRPLVRDILNDIMDAFDSPLIHAGFDEVEPMCKCRRCKGKSAGRIMLNHVKFAHGIITSRGRRMLVWHDKFLDKMEYAGSKALAGPHDARTALEGMPRDIVVCDWQYHSTADTTYQFTKKGFDAFVCDSDNGPFWRDYPFDFDSAWHTSRHYAQGRRAGAIGTIHTTWGDCLPWSRDAYSNRWLFYAHSLSAAWQPAQRIILRNMAATWGRVEMDIDGMQLESLIARLSVPLFGGTGMQFITRNSGQPAFPFAKSWWHAAGPDLLASERRFIDDLYGRAAELRRKAARNVDLVALLEYPIRIREACWDEVRCIGKAARLYQRLVSAKVTTAGQMRLRVRIAGCFRGHLKALNAVRACMDKVHKAEGLSSEAFSRQDRHIRLVAERAERFAGSGPVPAFEKIFWDESVKEVMR